MPSSTGGPRTSGWRLERVAWISLLLLVAQNVMGTALNLYISLPSSPTFLQVFVSVPLLTAHIATAFVLVGLGAALVILSRRSTIPRSTSVSAVALVSLIVAVQEGFAFTFTQDNAFSLGMEVAFLGAFASVAALLYIAASARPRVSPATPGWDPRGSN